MIWQGKCYPKNVTEKQSESKLKVKGKIRSISLFNFVQLCSTLLRKCVSKHQIDKTGPKSQNKKSQKRYLHRLKWYEPQAQRLLDRGSGREELIDGLVGIGALALELGSR